VVYFIFPSSSVETREKRGKRREDLVHLFFRRGKEGGGEKKEIFASEGK